jgi:adenylate cyclase
MDPRTTTEKDARRLRVSKLMTWMGFAFAAGWGITQFPDQTPGMWKAVAVNGVAALVYASLLQLARVAPLSAGVASALFTYAYLFALISLFGTDSGIQMYYLVFAGLTFALFGTERILLSAFFGLLGAALIAASEALLPRSTGLYTPTVRFAS